MREFYNRVLDRKVLTSWGKPQHKQVETMEKMKYSVMKKDDEGVVTEHWRYKTKRAAKACLNRMMKRILASEYVTVGEAGINYFKVVGSTFAHNEFIAKYYIQQNY